tara:strand:- start:1126 stop:1320 length:195 start_codon:yes stop_codon:yes gene_type:complete
MSKISEIDLGSSILSICIVAGFIATAFVFIRLTIIGVNYIKINYLREEVEDNDKLAKKSESKGF